MARPRKANSSGNQQRKDNLSSLSTGLLKLRLQALHLPVTGSRATLIAALRAAQSGGSARSAPKKKAAGRVAKRSTQAAFCVRFPEDLRRGFPNRSAYWRTIVVFGVKRRKTKPARRRRV